MNLLSRIRIELWVALIGVIGAIIAAIITVSPSVFFAENRSDSTDRIITSGSLFYKWWVNRSGCSAEISLELLRPYHDTHNLILYCRAVENSVSYTEDMNIRLSHIEPIDDNAIKYFNVPLTQNDFDRSKRFGFYLVLVDNSVDYYIVKSLRTLGDLPSVDAFIVDAVSATYQHVFDMQKSTRSDTKDM